MTILTTAGLFTACSSGDEDSIPVEKPRRITVEVTQRPLVGDAQARDFDTRSDITTEVPDFSLYGGSSSYTLSKATGKWVATPNKWPDVADDASVPFYAYTGGTFNLGDNGNSYVSLTVDENAFSQHDLLVATNTISFVSGGGKVPLTFDHACAAVAFNVYMSNTLKNNLAGKKLTVTSIVLKNVCNEGKYFYGTKSWTLVNNNVYNFSDYTLTNTAGDDGIEISTSPQALPCGNLFMIPQTISTNLEVSYKVGGVAKPSVNIPLSTTWAAGTKYTIDIKLGTSTITL